MIIFVVVLLCFAKSYNNGMRHVYYSEFFVVVYKRITKIKTTILSSHLITDTNLIINNINHHSKNGCSRSLNLYKKHHNTFNPI